MMLDDPHTGHAARRPLADAVEFLATAVLVFGIGVSLGISGYGGFLVPALMVALLGMGARDAVGHGLVSFIAPGAVGALLYWRRERRPSLTVAALLCLGTVPGTLVGRMVSVALSDTALRIVFGIVIVVAGLALLAQRRRADARRGADGRALTAKAALAVTAAGFLGGAAAVVAGVGGPLITVPILLSLGLELGPAVGAALLNSVLVAGLGALSLLSVVAIDPAVLVMVAAAQIAGVPLGVWLQSRIRPAVLVPVIGVASLLVGLFVIGRPAW